MKSQSSNFTGSVPEFYDSELGPRIFFDYADMLADSAAAVAPVSVLELAAGTGIVTRRLRDRLPDSCRILASDLNGPMLEVARSRFNHGEDIEFQIMDAMSLPLEDRSFSTAVCQFGVMFFPDQVKSYREVHRVLQPGGHYILNVWGSWDDNPFAQVVHNAVAKFFPNDPPGFYRVPFGYCDTDKISADFEAAGFTSVEIEPVEINSAIPCARNFSMGTIYGNPIAEEIRNRGGDPEEIRAAVEHAIATELGDTMPLMAIFIDAVK